MGLISDVWRLRRGKMVIRIFAVLGMIFICLLVKFFMHLREAGIAYQARLDAVKAHPILANGLVSPLSDEKAFVQILTGYYFASLDSLDLSEDLKGCVLHYDLRPSDFHGRHTSSVEFFLDCGCKRTGMYDILTVSIDPTTLRIDSLGTRRRVTQDTYEPFADYERR